MLCVCNYDDVQKYKCPICGDEILSFYIPEIDKEHEIIENLSIAICAQCKGYEVILWDKDNNELMRKAQRFDEPFKMCNFIKRTP